MPQMYDTDHSGTVSLKELLDALVVKGGALTGDDLTALMEKYDTDDNKELDMDEFTDLMRDVYAAPTRTQER